MQTKLLRRTEGQSLVVVALALVVLVALSGLAVDGARAFEERRRAATAADAAALSGTRMLAEARSSGGNGSAIRAAVQGSLSEHGLATAQSFVWEAMYTDRTGAVISIVTTGAIPSTARGVKVELSYRFNTFLMPVLGTETLPAAADAIAIYGPLGGPPFGGDLMPLTLSLAAAIDMQNNAGVTAIFGPSTGMYQGSPGAFGAVQLNPNVNGSNPSGNYNQCTAGPVSPPATAPDTLNYWWCHGTSHEINIGDLLYNDPGNISSLENALEYRLTNSPVGLMPIFDQSTGVGGNTTYRVVGFMAVELIDYDLRGRPANRFISARFVNFFVTTGAINPNPNALDTGVYAINLID